MADPAGHGAESSALFDLLLHPAIIGLVEGITVILLSSILFPVALRRAERISFCLQSLEMCGRLSKELIESRIAGAQNLELENRLTGMLADVGQALTECFGKGKNAERLNFHFARFRRALRYAEHDSGVVPTPETTGEVGQIHERVTRLLQRKAHGSWIWLALRNAKPVHH